mgnify:CR=1 FL=1
MAKYTNKKDEKIEVSDSHIDTAIRVKIELQNSSPSGKCNWRRHKRIMEREGFYDSDTNENYRCLIKAEQKSKGVLPSTEKYVNFVTDKKIETLETLVGDIYIANREKQNVNRLLSKTKREIADESIVISDIKKLISEIEIPKFEQKKISKNNDSEYIGVVTPSDWHIGMLFNDLNYGVAEKRVLAYADEVIAKSNLLKINELKVVHLGDIINHVYMHKNTQAYHSEFDVSTQIVKATKLMFAFLRHLSKSLDVVYLGTIVGNHGRMSNKGETLTNDNVEVVIHEMIKSMIDMANLENLSYDDSDYKKSFQTIKVKNRLIAFVHGDKESKTGADRIKKHSSIIGEQIDLLVQGHTHNFKVESENYERKIITSGALMGSDDYAQGLGFYTNASQLFLAVSEKDIIPLSISLNDVK